MRPMNRVMKQLTFAARGGGISGNSGNQFRNNGGGKRMTPVSWLGLGTTLLVGIAVVDYYMKEKERKQKAIIASQTKSIGTPALGGPWTLVNQYGKPVTDASIIYGERSKDNQEQWKLTKNSFGLLYFGFTHCPDICPTELHKMGDIIKQLDSKPGLEGVVNPIFITVDPQRDGIAQISYYIKDFHPRMVGLTGTPDQIAVACKAYRVYHNVADLNKNDEDDYLVDHSIVMYLVGPDGKFCEFSFLLDLSM